MDPRTVLVKAMAISYRISKINKPVKGHKDIVEDAMVSIDIENGENIDERRLVEGLVKIIRSLLETERDLSTIKSEISSTCRVDQDFAEDLIDVINNVTDDQKELSKEVGIEINLLRNLVKEDVIQEIFANANRQVRYGKNKISNLSEFVRDVITKLDNNLPTATGTHPAHIDSVMLNEPEKMTNLFKEAKDKFSGNRVLKFGWQHMNELLQGGIRQGELMLTPALQHNFKTGGTLTMTRQIAQYNEPHTENDKKKIIIRLSFEDSLLNNMVFLYKNIVFNETGEKVDIKTPTNEEMSKKVIDVMSKSGFEVAFHRLDPHSYSYIDIFELVSKYESDGYEVTLLVVDYLLKISLAGCDLSGPHGTAQRNLFEKFRDGCAAKDIAAIVPAQLGPKAKSTLDSIEDHDQFLPKIAGQGMTSGSSQIDQVVDSCIYFHKVVVDGKSWLHILMDKHRLPTTISENKKSFFLPFHETESIPDDLNEDKPISVRKLATSTADLSGMDSFF